MARWVQARGRITTTTSRPPQRRRIASASSFSSSVAMSSYAIKRTTRRSSSFLRTRSPKLRSTAATGPMRIRAWRCGHARQPAIPCTWAYWVVITSLPFKYRSLPSLRRRKTAVTSFTVDAAGGRRLVLQAQACAPLMGTAAPRQPRRRPRRQLRNPTAARGGAVPAAQLLHPQYRSHQMLAIPEEAAARRLRLPEESAARRLRLTEEAAARRLRLTEEAAAHRHRRSAQSRAPMQRRSSRSTS